MLFHIVPLDAEISPYVLRSKKYLSLEYFTPKAKFRMTLLSRVFSANSSQVWSKCCSVPLDLFGLRFVASGVTGQSLCPMANFSFRKHRYIQERHTLSCLISCTTGVMIR
jgi:hypothetical protein